MTGGTPALGRPTVSVVVVGYGAPDLLERCLTRLLQVVDDRTEVVVVDNNSRPSLRPVLRKFVPRVRAFTAPINLGFGPACNAARALCSGELLLLLNPDAVLEPGALPALVDHIVADPIRGMVTGRLRRPSGELDPYSALGRPGLWSEICFGTGLSALSRRSNLLDPYDMPGWKRDDERTVGVVTGCVMLVRTDLWDRLDGFDPRYFMYGEDVDLSLRARELGYRLAFLPRLVATHVGGGSSSSVGKTVMVLRGKATLQWRHRSPARRYLSTLLLHSGVALRAVLDRLREPQRRVWAEAWRRRAEWCGGWPPATTDAGRPPVLEPVQP